MGLNIFILAVLVIALSTWVVWFLLDSPIAFPAMLAVLVASCPCALSLALPAVYAAASQRLLNEGNEVMREGHVGVGASHCT